MSFLVIQREFPGLRPMLWLPPLFPLSAPLIRELSKMKAVLKAQIGGLKQVLTLQHELSDLSSQIRELQLTMGTDPSQDKQKNPNPNMR